jgi:hypothetical protein
MKSRDLIRFIQEIDPSGEKDVCINNMDFRIPYLSRAKDQGWYFKIDYRNGDYYDLPEAISYIGDGYKINISPWKPIEIFQSYPSIKTNVIGNDKDRVREAFLENLREDSNRSKAKNINF